MVIFENLDKYRKMRLWINEIPADCDAAVVDNVLEYKANKNIHWFNGILCLELFIAPRHTSNYAMLCLKFTESPSSKFQVIYYSPHSDATVMSDVAMLDNTVKTDIVSEFGAALTQTFDELHSQNIFPGGTLEILGGRHGLVGSSPMAFEIVLKILIKLLERNENLCDDDTAFLAEIIRQNLDTERRACSL